LLEELQGQDILKDISDDMPHYLLGSISPDIFYYSGKESLEKISEFFHGKTGNPTNVPIISMLEAASGPKDISFILGYITHCALDITFHPAIYYLSGNYYNEDPAKRMQAIYMHRHLETCVDRDLGNTMRLHETIRTSLLEGIVFERYISHAFMTDPRTTRHVLRRQIVSNMLFTSRTAYRIAGAASRVGLLKDRALLGLFYGDVGNGKCLPQTITIQDLISGEERTTTVAELLSLARAAALPMMKAAYAFHKGDITRDELVRAIPGVSLDTGKLGVTPASIRYTKG
jgi:hypothetical protein